MRIVLDTNVIVSGLLSVNGPPAEILRGVLDGLYQVCYSPSILHEYVDVLNRPQFPFPKDEIHEILGHLIEKGGLVFPNISTPSLPDPTDEKFLAVALSARVDFLITGNLKHFPKSKRQGVTVLSPKQFIETIR